VGADLVGALGPGERVGAFVPAVDGGPDGGLEVFDVVERAAADRLAGDDPEEDLHVQPAPAGLGEVQVHAGCLGSHALTLGCLWVA